MGRRVDSFEGRILRSPILWLVLGAIPGCTDPLLPAKDDRSQFAGYDRVRERTVEPYRDDEFGRRRPNLRGRLLSRE